MKKLKKVLCFVIPIVLIVAITLGVVIPLCVNRGETKIEKTLADETGAGTASMSDKGGAIYVESGGRYTHNGGTISGKSKMYGGAVFVADGGHFTMESGEISGCSAKYGGAIYVANGGECIINGGTITKNKAEVAPAIYVENGGKLTVSGNAVIEDNEEAKYIVPPKIGEEETMGGTYEGTASTVKLKTMYFGSYPQTYVGDSMNTTLENWYSGKKVEKTYTIRDSQVWDAYEYTDGQLYARGSSKPNSSSYTYHDGTTVKANGTAVWFKVEPIKWYIMNYDAWQSGTENIELLSELALTSYIRFNPSESDGNNWKDSELQKWLRDEFYKSAFDENEREIIALTQNKNNVTGEYNKAPDTWTGADTEDYVYCKTYYEMGHDMFSTSSSSGNGYAAKLCSPTDFALSNYCYMDTSYTTNYRTGTCYWWLRSAGSSASYACGVHYRGGLYGGDGVNDRTQGVRSALHLILNR